MTGRKNLNKKINFDMVQLRNQSILIWTSQLAADKAQSGDTFALPYCFLVYNYFAYIQTINY